ncbi:unnamed protein product [Nezara viridula]|uniref:Phospholipase A-2-activating protein n=1 Tax=Nezara viridula TaxID=85310 RepID=A0A9P0EB08_NEZVI|nr:unnamed protein product [Nezara viridula]
MDQCDFNFRCEVFAHSNDVRAVCVMDNAIVSGSRDLTAKLWAEIRGCYESCASLKGHSNYISAVCVLVSSSQFPLGLILTGGHDHKIFGFLPYTQEPLLTLEGHSGPVCCLSPSLKTDFVLSSSWDCTAKIWDVYRQCCVFTIYGHMQTIWAVINIPTDYIVTGSADKTIKVFSSDLVNIHTLSGHSDCVRGLSYLHETLVISCSNDGSLRTWNVKDGSCLSILEVHSNYIYSVKAVFEKDLIVAGCEDKTLCIIYKGKQQNIVLPAQSIWTVDILPNLDIVTGSSDGYIRIFTSSISRQASARELEAFEKQLSGQKSWAEPVSDVNKFVPAEQVTDEGEFDGQLKFVTVLDHIKCFKWSQSDSQWFPLENVTNSEQESDTQSGFYEGKVYDFLFDIFIEGDITSPFKLPYKIGQDISTVAQNFIHKHHLNPEFSMVVKNFLDRSIQKPIEYMETPELKDKMFELFSIPGTFILFKKFDQETVIERLDDYWQQQRLSKTVSLQFMKGLMTLPNENLDPMLIDYGVQQLVTFINMWPKCIVYPVLDVTRIALIRPKVNKYIFQGQLALDLFDSFKQFMDENCSHNNRMLVCRILCNMFSSVEGINFVFAHKEFIFSHLPMSKFSEKHKGFEIALASLLLNFSVEAIKRKDIICLTLCYDISESVLMSIKEEEAVFRLLVTIGTLCLSLKKKLYPSRLFDQLKFIASWKNRDNDASQKAARCASFLISQNVSLVLKRDSSSDD